MWKVFTKNKFSSFSFLMLQLNSTTANGSNMQLLGVNFSVPHTSQISRILLSSSNHSLNINVTYCSFCAFGTLQLHVLWNSHLNRHIGNFLVLLKIVRVCSHLTHYTLYQDGHTFNRNFNFNFAMFERNRNKDVCSAWKCKEN